MKKISIRWSLLVGLLTVAVQVITFYVRFGRMNTDSTFVDYFLFFIAGTVGGLILIYFLNRQTSTGKRWMVVIAFLLATPIAMFMVLGGGLLGPLGVILFPQIPWALMVWPDHWLES
jgi:RsiW-degrading membrane proteinase PrsW (M82 family)